jgi:hypothetical protein
MIDEHEKPVRPGRPLQPARADGARTPPRPLGPAPGARPRGLRVIKGEGQGRDETLHTRDDVVRLLVSSAADLLLKRISTERAHEIELRVNRIMRLFDRLDDDPIAMPLLRRELDDLEAIWREGQARRRG